MEVEIFNLLSKSIATEYAHEIAAEIAEIVRIDLEETASPEYNESDLRLAVGRALCDKMFIVV